MGLPASTDCQAEETSDQSYEARPAQRKLASFNFPELNEAMLRREAETAMLRRESDSASKPGPPNGAAQTGRGVADRWTRRTGGFPGESADFPANRRRRTCRGHHKGGVGLSRFDAGSRCASTATPGFWHAAVCFRRAILRGRRRANRPGLGDTAGSRALRLASCAGRLLVGAQGRGNRTRDLTKYPSRRQNAQRRRELGCLLDDAAHSQAA